MTERGTAVGWVSLDGSAGEGGGQILRTALSLSLITGRPLRLKRIRANRTPSGLRPQHLACVRGAAALANAHVEGAEVGAPELSFAPGLFKGGNKLLLEVGSAGSTPLLFQCLFYPMALRGGGELTLRGGTHVSHSPSYHYLTRVWVPAIQAFGLFAEFKLLHAGFYPEGGGEFRATISPHSPPAPSVNLAARGTLLEAEVMSFVGGLAFETAEKQGRAAEAALREAGISCEAENLPLPTTRSVGSVVFIRAQFERTVAGFTALGERGASPESTGRAAAKQLAEFMKTAGSVDKHLGDQLLIPSALLAAGRLGPAKPGTTSFTTEAVTPHLETNAEVLKRFLPVEIEIRPAGEVHVKPRADA